MSEDDSSSNTDRLRVLYLCYLSLDDPLVDSQVLAYLTGLARRGHTVHLLTWEKRRLTPRARRARRRRLRALGIAWHGLRYHSRPSLPATIYDVANGAFLATWLVVRHRLDAVHARSHVAAAAALGARRLTGCRFIFDIRGLMAEEYSDVGRWKRGGVPFRLVKSIERRGVGSADGIVVLTQRLRDAMFPPADRRVFVIPCCVDLHRIDAAAPLRDQVRAELDVHDAPVLVYVGKFTGWYMERETAAFFAVASELRPELHFLILSQSDHELIRSCLRERSVPEDSFTITQASAAEVGGFLAAADAAISFVRPLPSKISSSPTKIGEYLAAGLPIVSSANIGDVDELLGTARCGVLVHGFDDASLRASAEKLFELMSDAEATSRRARDVARRELDLERAGIARYDRLYRAVAGRHSPSG